MNWLIRIRRFFKHSWYGATVTRKVITVDMAQRLQRRVAASEQRHSGEIRIYVERRLPFTDLFQPSPTRQLTRARAVKQFAQLGVWDTASNNGVLIYLLLAERAIEIVADRGLNVLVEQAAWNAMANRMRMAFKQGQFEDGLTQALEELSALLIQHFPVDPAQSNANELPDAPVMA